MKIKTLLILFALLGVVKIYGQTKEEDAITYYQLAQEQFDKGQFKDVLNYLNKVDALNPAAKTKTSYLKAKCYDNLIEQSYELKNDSMYVNLFNNIQNYFDNGKDEAKKKELLKLKLKAEGSEKYKESKLNADKQKAQKVYKEKEARELIEKEKLKSTHAEYVENFKKATGTWIYQSKNMDKPLLLYITYESGHTSAGEDNDDGNFYIQTAKDQRKAGHSTASSDMFNSGYADGFFSFENFGYGNIYKVYFPDFYCAEGLVNFSKDGNQIFIYKPKTENTDLHSDLPSNGIIYDDKKEYILAVTLTRTLK